MIQKTRLQCLLPAGRAAMLLITVVLMSMHLQAQQKPAPATILSPGKVTAVFTDSLKKALDIRFSIYRVYQYTDRSGSYYCVLTESQDSVAARDTFRFKIKAFNFKADNGGFTKVWELNDHIVKGEYDETSIWFWTKYVDFKDYDNDGLIEPVIVYGTSGMNGYDDGRIKFLIYFKGQKIAIRHQNGVLDSERETRVDKVYYTLPQTLQSAIRTKMDLMTENGHAIFPHGWQTAMKNKKTFFSERGD